jgi:hypothetical protein
MAGRLNQISKRLRVLPFAVLDKFKAMSMSKFDIYDGGIGALDYTVTDSAIHTQTIRLDTLPSFNLLFPSKEDTKKFNIPKGRLDDRSVLEPEDLGKEYATDIKKSLDGDGVGVKLSNALLWNQPIHFLKIDVEGFELPALKSAARLFEAGLVEHTVLEFGPPHRWDAIVENSEGKSTEEIRKQTMGMAKDILHRAVNEWDLDIYLLPAIGWSKTVEWMLDHGVDYSKGDAKKNKVVHKLKAWNFDQLAADHDEFEKELESKDNLVTEFIPLPDHLIDDYLEASEDIGEMYLWFAKRDSDSAVLEKQEL